MLSGQDLEIGELRRRLKAEHSVRKACERWLKSELKSRVSAARHHCNIVWGQVQHVVRQQLADCSGHTACSSCATSAAIVFLCATTWTVVQEATGAYAAEAQPGLSARGRCLGAQYICMQRPQGGQHASAAGQQRVCTLSRFQLYQEVGTLRHVQALARALSSLQQSMCCSAGRDGRTAAGSAGCGPGQGASCSSSSSDCCRR
jgi:hypothetical protein